MAASVPMAEAAKTTYKEIADWDEAQLKVALARIDKVQEQIDGLRIAFPAIIVPHKKYDSRSVLFRRFKVAAMRVAEDMKKLADTWRSDEVLVFRRIAAEHQRQYR
ncbi:hypothetical protein LTR66_011256 [Elasticomyces elasticus]|nr:hypothetical protein LTR66_011256 [Elasticomyces elasticus]KAK5008254.1 hypothetical protein LTR28_004234 [Elasticomyces elasticus]